MSLARDLLLNFLAAFCFLLEVSCVVGRIPYHTKNKGSEIASALYGSISQPPVYSPANAPDPSIAASNLSSDSLIFDVRSFGAIGDGSTDDTRSFESAWQASCKVEDGVFLVPSGFTFTITSTIFTGPCREGFTFQLDGVLMPPNGPDLWPKTDSRRQWLVFYRADEMVLQGDGMIEGNGQNWWDLPCKPHKGPNGSTLPGPCDSPTAIRFVECSNVTVRQIKIQNSPMFHVRFDSCEAVLIDSISISSPALSPNTDGIHIENTRHVGIYNSRISNGDDCISIGAGCSDVDIENVTCGPSHGISIGSLGYHNSVACVSNISVSNSVIQNSDNGVRIKTWQGGMGSVKSISFTNVLMDNVRNCIMIDQYYCMTKGCMNQTSAVLIADVAYRSIKGTYDVRSPPIHFACSDTMPCTNITLADVELLPSEGEMVADPFCWNAFGQLESVTIPPILCLQDGEPLSLIEGSPYNC